MGHSTTRAAMIYLHGSDARQRQIAETLSKLTRQGLGQSGRPVTAETGQTPSGMQRARRRYRTS